MRTEQDIVERLKKKPESFFGFDREVLLRFVPFEVAKPHLHEDYLARDDAEEDWEKDRLSLEEAVIKKDMADYMDFAWGKASDHRGLSASRSIEKMEAYLWLLGDDELLEELKGIPYDNYGCPKLAAICEKYGLPIPQDEGVQNMIDSRPCGADYSCGCGS